MTNLIKKISKINEPNLNISVKKVFNIDWNIEIPAFSEKSAYVPDIDENYFFEEDTTKAIIAGFKYNRRVMVQGTMVLENLLI